MNKGKLIVSLIIFAIAGINLFLSIMSFMEKRKLMNNGGIVNMCGNFSASVLYPFAAIRETSVCGYQCQGFPRSGACTLDTDIHICYNF